MPRSKDIGNKDFYEYYKQLAIGRGKPYVNYTTYAKILRDFNTICRDKILYKAERITLPYRLGSLYVKKFERIHSERNKRVWPIDFKATKEQGHTVYFDSKYGYKWRWYKKEAQIKGKRWYSFRACKQANRLIADAINNKQLDFFE